MKRLTSSTHGIENNDFFRNRSCSLATPIAKETHYLQKFTSGGRTLTRAISLGYFCGEKNGQLYETKQVKVSNYITPSKNSSDKMKFIKFKPPTRKPKKMIPEPKTEGTKHEQEPGNILSRFLLQLYRYVLYSMYALLAVFVAGLYVKWYASCSDMRWEIDQGALNLKRLVYGQEEAIALINSHLEEAKLNDFTKPLLLLLTGSSGVGKSHTASVLLENFPWKQNIQTMESNLAPESANLSPCGVNVVVIEYLLKDIKVVLKLVTDLLKETQSNKKLVIFVIFRTKTEETSQQLLNIFSQVNISVDLIPFRELSFESIKRCFVTEFDNNNYIINENQLDDMVEKHVEEMSDSGMHFGCKGVHEKVSVLVN